MLQIKLSRFRVRVSSPIISATWSLTVELWRAFLEHQFVMPDDDLVASFESFPYPP